MEYFTDLPKTLDRLDLFQDDWGYLVLWATLGVADWQRCRLILVPVVFGWRGGLRAGPRQGRHHRLFRLPGIGYIMVEVGLISRFT